jgi:IS30 family transposase
MRHGRIAKALGAESYFCLPYHPWEKGAVEQMNGLIRRYLLKKESFGYEEADHYWLELIEAALNSRPRRVLGYRTPEEVAGELTGQH